MVAGIDKAPRGSTQARCDCSGGMVPVRALSEAYKVIAKHYEEYYPARYKKWLAERSAFSSPRYLGF